MALGGTEPNYKVCALGLGASAVVPLRLCSCGRAPAAGAIGNPHDITLVRAAYVFCRRRLVYAFVFKNVSCLDTG